MTDVVCDLARKRYLVALAWKNLWTVPLFVFGVVLVIFATVALLFYVQASWLPAALSVAGALVDFGGLTWLVKRRSDAVTEEESAFQDVVKYCKKAVGLQVLDEAGAKKRRAQLEQM